MVHTSITTKIIHCLYNSALVKVAKAAGAGAAAGAVGSALATAGVTGVSASVISTAVVSIIGQLPSSHGAWFRFSKDNLRIISFGKQWVDLKIKG